MRRNLCSVDGCKNFSYAKGMCKSHYQKSRYKSVKKDINYILDPVREVMGKWEEREAGNKVFNMDSLQLGVDFYKACKETLKRAE